MVTPKVWQNISSTDAKTMPAAWFFTFDVFIV
jgi:hypothetical protein